MPNSFRHSPGLPRKEFRVQVSRCVLWFRAFFFFEYVTSPFRLGNRRSWRKVSLNLRIEASTSALVEARIVEYSRVLTLDPKYYRAMQIGGCYLRRLVSMPVTEEAAPAGEIPVAIVSLGYS